MIKVLSFGEILWDIFENGKAIGGAPFNFAAHLAALGAESYLVTSVGNDENGREAIESAVGYGIKRDFLFTDRKHPTGYCEVKLQNGCPKYDLKENVAYDYIPDPARYGSYDAIYTGTLALRSPESRRTFEKLLKYTEYREMFFDMNLRGSFYTRELVDFLLKKATVLKLSDEEITFFGRKDKISVILEITAKYRNLKYICLTLGPEGAMVYDTRKREILFSDKPKSAVVSTVGAGDSFSAALIYGMLSGKPMGECLDGAIKLSDYVVTHLGAVPKYDKNFIFSE